MILPTFLHSAGQRVLIFTKRVSRRFANYLVQFFHVQLFITTISLPLLLWWGMPLSLLSPLGNMFFNPLLGLFLLLSSLIFFAYLLALPYGLLLSALTMLTSWWTTCMNFIPHHCFVTLPKPPWWLAFGMVIASCTIIRHKKCATPARSIAALTTVLLLFCAYSWGLQKPDYLTFEIPCNNGNVFVLHEKGRTVIIDPGFIGQRLSAPSWIEYSLLPTLMQKTGTSSIHTFICLQPTTMLFEALALACQKTTISTLALPFWQGSLTPAGWRSYFALCKTTKEHNSTITRLKNYTHRLGCGRTACTIEPCPHTIKQQDISYKAYAVHLSWEKNLKTIYSAKYSHANRENL